MQAFCCPDDTGRWVLTPTARNRIKMATRELRHLTGLTLEEAASRTGISTTSWHNYENPAKPDLIPAQVYLPLELELGDAPVTRAIAQINGLTIERDGDRVISKKVAELMAVAAREQGEALAVLIAALADGKLTPNEARQVVKEYLDVRHNAEEIVNFATDAMSSALGGH